jgi:hypothetical protein
MTHCIADQVRSMKALAEATVLWYSAPPASSLRWPSSQRDRKTVTTREA